MYIAKKHIPRRRFLKGAGCTLALPLLDAMLPASTAFAATAGTPKPRFVGMFFPHGMAPGYWEPGAEGPLPAKLPYILESLGKVRDQTVVLSGLWSKSAEPPEGTTGSDHWVAAAYLTGIKPRKTAGSDATVGSPTIDQIIACDDLIDRRAADRRVAAGRLARLDPGEIRGGDPVIRAGRPLGRLGRLRPEPAQHDRLIAHLAERLEDVGQLGGQRAFRARFPVAWRHAVREEHADEARLGRPGRRRERRGRRQHRIEQRQRERAARTLQEPPPWDVLLGDVHDYRAPLRLSAAPAADVGVGASRAFVFI